MEAPAESSNIHHPFAHSNSMLEPIPANIDVEEESRLYDSLCDDAEVSSVDPPSKLPSHLRPPAGPPSIFSREIWLGDNSDSGNSLAFARDVKVSGWTSVGDKLGGAYIVYDCVISTKEGTVIHAHKRYSSFVELEIALMQSLPPYQRHLIPQLPPKFPLARYRPTFLERRRLKLQYWLSAILLNPDIGGSEAVRRWVMN